MDTTNIATITGFIATLLTLAGITGITTSDVQGFITVIGAIISHKTAITAALNTPAPTQQG